MFKQIAGLFTYNKLPFNANSSVQSQYPSKDTSQCDPSNIAMKSFNDHLLKNKNCVFMIKGGQEYRFNKAYVTTSYINELKKQGFRELNMDFFKDNPSFNEFNAKQHVPFGERVEQEKNDYVIIDIPDSNHPCDNTSPLWFDPNYKVKSEDGASKESSDSENEDCMNADLRHNPNCKAESIDIAEDEDKYELCQEMLGGVSAFMNITSNSNADAILLRQAAKTQLFRSLSDSGRSGRKG